MTPPKTQKKRVERTILYRLLYFSIYICSVGGSPTFFRALQTHDRQAVEPPSGGVRLAVRFFVKKNTKKKTACPRIEPLFTANRGSISNKQRLCFIPTEPLFFYSFPQSHLLHPRGVTQNNIISVLQPPIQPKYHHTVQNTPIPAKKDLHEQPFMHYLRSRIRQCMHNGDNPQSTTSK